MRYKNNRDNVNIMNLDIVYAEYTWYEIHSIYVRVSLYVQSLYVRTSLLKFSLVCTYTYMLPEISVSLYVRTDFLKFQEMIFKFPRKFVRLDLKSTFPVL